MRQTNSFAALVFIVILAIGAALAYAMYGISADWVSNQPIAAALIVAFVFRSPNFFVPVFKLPTSSAQITASFLPGLLWVLKWLIRRAISLESISERSASLSRRRSGPLVSTLKPS